jgi:uncharacterized protein YciI
MLTAPLHSFMVYAPDYPDALERRKQVREQHLSGIKELLESGVFSAYQRIYAFLYSDH